MTSMKRMREKPWNSCINEYIYEKNERKAMKLLY